MKWSYFYQHWFTTLLTAPIICKILETLFGKDFHQIVGLLEFYPITLIISLILSTPTYIFYALLYNYLGKKNVKNNLTKAILITFSILGIIISFNLLNENTDTNISSSYIIASIISGISYKLELKQNDNN